MEEALGRVFSLAQAPDAIELRHLRAFVAVAEELNFGRAAARIYLSPPALSRQISALERLVGCDLLRRNTHRVELTLAGDAFLDCARALLTDLDRGVSATRAVGGELLGRVMRYWEPIGELATADASMEDMRRAYEALHSTFRPPPEIDVRPVNAGGTPALLLGPTENPPPTALHLHGGANVMGSAFGYRALCGAIAAAAGGTVLVPEYRLAPEHPFPAGPDDSLRAYLWLLGQGVPPDRVTVLGDSSGALLAHTLLMNLRERELPMPGGVALLCPAIDLTCDTFRPPASKGPPVVTLEQMRSWVAAYLAGHPMDDPVISPLTADLSGFPPMLIQAATGDYVADDAHLLADRAREHGVDVSLELYPIDTHVFHVFWSFLPEAADAVAQVGHFVKRTADSAQVRLAEG